MSNHREKFIFFKRATLILLVVLVGSIGCIWAMLYQPWRYVRVAHQDELVLPRDSVFPRQSDLKKDIMFIEAPDLDLKAFEKEIHAELPPLYKNFPADLPKEIMEYLELRNIFIHQLHQAYYYQEHDLSPHPRIHQILPFVYDDQLCFFALKELELILYDTELNKLHEIKNRNFLGYIFVSSKFMDRFWVPNISSAATGVCKYIRAVMYLGELKTDSILLGCHYDFELHPYDTMKISRVSSDPVMKTHISRPYDILKFSSHNNPLPKLIEFFARIMLWIFFIATIVSFPLFVVSLLILLIQGIILLFNIRRA